MGCGGSRNGWQKSVRGVGSKAIENQALIDKYNQKLGFALVYLYDNALQLITSKAITQSINTRRNNMEYSKQAVLMMFREGSGFTSRLADLWLVADTKHRNQIENAFRDLFDQWEDRYERHLEIMVEAEANR
jgi:hypothetical protein